ncbi:hypothetical protein NCC49_001792 [Naganishia albida]|nr:hypothetical protein NCC49_001792 [Naganishia albida]
MGVKVDDDDVAIGKKIAWGFFKEIWEGLVEKERSRRAGGRLTIPLSAFELYIIDQWCIEKHAEMFPRATRKK